MRSREPTNSQGAVKKGLTARPDGKDISEGLPFKGMDVSLLDQTWLGAHDEEGEQIQGGLYDGGTSYRWLARNGTGDRVFSAIALDGVVAQVTKENLSKDYWANPGSVMPKELPDREAAGTAVVASGSSPIPEEAPDGAEDPLDYDDPEDYAAANERAFELQGTSTGAETLPDTMRGYCASTLGFAAMIACSSEMKRSTRPLSRRSSCMM